MNVYPKNLRKSREKLLETITENLSKVTTTENGIQKLITFLNIHKNQIDAKMK